jgi:hypothetical protein
MWCAAGTLKQNDGNNRMYNFLWPGITPVINLPDVYASHLFVRMRLYRCSEVFIRKICKDYGVGLRFAQEKPPNIEHINPFRLPCIHKYYTAKL